MAADDHRDNPTGPDSSPLTVHGADVRFWLEYRSHQFDVSGDSVTIGRSAGCEIVLDDALVSRRHARVVRGVRGVVVEDLGSANGVLVNGERVEGSRLLEPGDLLTIGQQQMVLRSGTRFRQRQQRERFTAATLSGFEATALMGGEVTNADAAEPDSTHRGNALLLLGGVADKILALRRGDEAERILGAFLDNLIEDARTGRMPDTETAARAVEYAVKLAAVTERAKWVDYGIEFYTLLRRPMPAAIVDELYQVLRRVRNINRGGLSLYLNVLHARQAQFGPAERFLLQRIEGLERLAKL